MCKATDHNQVQVWTNEDNAGWMFYQIGGVSLDLAEDGRVSLQAFGVNGLCDGPEDLADFDKLAAILSHPEVQAWIQKHT